MNKPNLKPNKLWVDKGRKIHDKPMQEWFENNDILMYSIHHESKSVITGKFIKTLKSKFYKN